MAKQKKGTEQTVSLRAQAETWLTEHPDSPLPENSAVLHDLQVHQVELQIQNEELRATQSQLSAANEEYVDLYDHAPVGYGTLSIEGQVLRANRTLALLLGTDLHSLRGQNLHLFVVPADQDKFFLFLRGLNKSPAHASVILMLKKSAGDQFWSRIDGHRVVGAGSVTFRVVLGDISTERTAEAALEVNARLESLGALAGGIAHDFNNLLGGILGYVSLAKEAADGSPKVVHYLEKADSVFDRARNLTQQLMAFSKQSPHQTKVVSLQPLVEKAAAFILSGRETLVRVTSTSDLWPAMLDEAQISQVVDNLVLNASQAMKGFGRVDITLKNTTLAAGTVPTLAAGYYLEMTVTDTGPGIDPALLTKIFAPFFTTKTEGHGLGLASAQSIVKKHGGAIWSESAPGKGTIFHVILPAVPAGTCAETEQQPTRHHGSGTVLVMDDEEFNLEIFSAMLASLGYTTLEATDGTEALRLCRTCPDLKAAFLDLTNKGGTGGKDTVGPLLDAFPCLPVFAVSGYCEDPIMAKPQDFGFSESLAKPFRKEELSALLTKYLTPAAP